MYMYLFDLFYSVHNFYLQSSIYFFLCDKKGVLLKKPKISDKIDKVSFKAQL